MSAEEATLAVAVEVARVLEAHEAPCAVIGAVALAVHRYPRATRDLDLGTLLRSEGDVVRVAEDLRACGLEVDVALADRDDPLGGVLTVRREGADPVQVVNFFNPWNGWAPAGKAALDTATPGALGALAVVDVPHLVALKLYAGGRRSALDILELLSRHSPEVLEETRAVCRTLALEAALESALGADSKR